MAINKDPASGLGKGFGFVTYKSKEAADKAKATLHLTPLKDFADSKVRAPPWATVSLPTPCSRHGVYPQQSR